MTFTTGGASGLHAFSIFIALAAFAVLIEKRLIKNIQLIVLSKDITHLRKKFGWFESWRQSSL